MQEHLDGPVGKGFSLSLRLCESIGQSLLFLSAALDILSLHNPCHALCTASDLLCSNTTSPGPLKLWTKFNSVEKYLHTCMEVSSVHQRFLWWNGVAEMSTQKRKCNLIMVLLS